MRKENTKVTIAVVVTVDASCIENEITKESVLSYIQKQIPQAQITEMKGK